MALCLYAALPGQGVAWGQTEGEVRFSSTPESVSYAFIYEGNSRPTTIYSYFFIHNITEGMAVRVQLTDGVAPDGFGFRSDSEQPEETLDNGGFWVSDEMLEISGNYANLNFVLSSSKECTVEYTVSVYASKDLSAASLASSTQTARFLPSGQRPSLASLERISGELNTDIPVAIGLNNVGFLQGQPARIKIYLNGGNTGVSLSGQDLTWDSNNSVYILDIPSCSTQRYTLTARATEACSGTYRVEICDADGNSVVWGSEASIIIPIEYSADDIEALKAIAAANPLNNDLQNFISSGDYLKDRETGNNYQVGVQWNTENPSRVRMFFIEDYRTNTVSSLDVSALTGLEELRLQGTRLESLDLSALTKLRYLSLYDNSSLSWATVKFPSPLPENFRVNGSTRIPAGTPVDDYNAYAASGTEIDLSAYAEVAGVKSTYRWYRMTRDPYSSEEATMPAVSGKEGAFVFTGKPGEYYRCEIRNANYGDWYLQTPDIKVARGSADYSQVDIDGLKKLAADNPDATQLTEFVESKGWERENWDSYQDVIRTDWDTENRLTRLYINFEWNSGDTISSLDLSAFTELRYFESERYLNIEKLDLSKNTKLEHLSVYSKNLVSIDLSKCPELQYFRFGEASVSYSSYQPTLLTGLNLAGCAKLSELYLENTPLASLDISSLKNLTRLELEHCPNLSVKGFDSATKLEYLALPHTSQFGDLIQDLPSSLRHLYLQDTEYELPSSQSAKNLQTLGIPDYVESFDLAQYPNLLNLQANGSQLRYSTLKGYRSINYNGMSHYPLTSPSHPDDSYLFENGDTIDLSSEAVINGVETVFLWVNAKYGIEEKEALKPVPDRPGVFVLDSEEEGYGDYYCKMMNTQFCRISEINVRSGWQMETSYFHVETSVPQVFAEGDVATLARIVGDSNNKDMEEWWSSNRWQTNGDFIVWNNENPRRITELSLTFGDLAKEVDLLALDKLERLYLTSPTTEKLALPKNNTVLRELLLDGSSSLTSLIVSEYPSLEELYLGYTGLKACDVSNNKRLRYLYLTGTEIGTIEETNPDIAAQLLGYGVPKATTSIDLADFPSLIQLGVGGSGLEFTGVMNPRQLEWAGGLVELPVGKARPNIGSYGFSSYGETIDLSAQQAVAGVASDFAWVMDRDTIDRASGYTITENLNPGTWVSAHVTNPLFPGWELIYSTRVYTCDGDANLDRKVNVQDVTATVSYILNDEENMIANFGYDEADVNYDNNVQIADVIGIVNIIRDQPVSKASDLRAETTLPVRLELDADNFLTMTSQVPVAGIYLELVGATEELPLLGDAAKLLQASSLNGDTLRIVAYSLDGKTIPSGKSRVLRMPAGVTLVDASFSDALANSLRAEGDVIVTSNAPIEAISRMKAVSNHPNPFRGSTTFSYQLEEPAQTVTIHVYSANGALAALLSGLPGEVGENQYTARLTLPAGVYYYRLTAKTGHGVKASNTNIFICK